MKSVVRCLCCVVLYLLFQPSTYSQTKNAPGYPELKEKGMNAWKQNQPDSVSYYFKLALTQAANLEDSTTAYVEIIWGHYFARQVDSARSFAHQLTAFTDRLDYPKGRSSLANAYRVLRHTHYDIGQVQKASEYSLKELELVKNDSVGFKQYLAASMNLSTEYWTLKRYDESLRVAEESLARMDGQPELFNALKVRAMIMIGLVNADLGNTDKAVEFYEASMGVPVANKNADLRNRISVLNNLANVYGYEGDTEKEVATYEEARRVVETNKDLIGYGNYKTRILANHSKALTNMERFAEADKIANEALATYKKHLNEKDPILASCYYSKGIALIGLGKLKEGETYMLKAIEAAIESFGPNASKVLYYLYETASFYFEQDDFNSVEEYLTRLENNHLTYTLSDVKLYEFPQPAILAATLKLSLLEETIEDQNILLDSVKVVYADIIGQAVEAYTLTRANRKYTQELLFLLYDISFRLLQNSNDPELKNILWELTELDKSRRLMYHLNDKSALEKTIPADLRSKQRLYQDSILYYTNLILEDSTADRSKLVTVKNQFSLLQRQIEERFPEYSEIKKVGEVIPWQEFANKPFANDKLVIEYLLTDSVIYTTVLQNNNFRVDSIWIDDDFEQEITSFIKSLNSPLEPEEHQNYVRLSHGLYKKLLAPILKDNQPEKLLIIPSGSLALIPFEALLTEPVSSENIDFSQLPYLLNSTEVEYANSATLLNSLSSKSGPQKGLELLAFAPSFESSGILDSMRGSLGNLTYNIEEAENLGKYFTTTVLKSMNASEHRFHELAGDFDIIHIATHALVDDSDPMNSKIVFQQNENDSLGDGYLHVFELLNSELNAELAVLSACRTGLGQIEPGEGVMSLAQAFFYSGTRSVIMSLWPANDQSTAKIMDLFYANVSRGLNKSTALRAAKLGYLENSDNIKSHPFYWAQFVANGNMRPFDQDRSYMPYYLSGAIILLLLVLIKRRNVRHS